MKWTETTPKTTEEALENQTADRWAALRGLPYFLEVNTQGFIVDIPENQANTLSKELGLENTPLLGTPWTDLLEEDPQFPWKTLSEAALNHQSTQEFPLMLRSKTQDPLYFHCKLQYCSEEAKFKIALQRVGNSEGELSGLLQTKLNHFKLSLQTADMGLWDVVLGPDLKTATQINWDAAVSRMHGIPPGMSVNTTTWFYTHAHPEDVAKIKAKYMEYMSRGAPSLMEDRYRMVWPNGEIHYIEVHGSISPPSAHDSRIRMYGVAQDITEEVLERKRLEDQKTRILANSHMTVLGEISGGLAHEINNPLTVIQARAFQLLQMIEQNSLEPAKIRAVSESISKTADKIAKIVKSIRAFSQSHENTPFDLVSIHELIEETLDFCRVRFYNHHVEVKLETIPRDLEIECRLIQIEEVILNLLNNAHDAVLELPEKWIHVEALNKGDDVEIHITDSGLGISEDVANQMMLPFFSTKFSGQGTGLGLSISAEIVQAHHGQLTLDRTSKNTRFILRLPKRQPNHESA
jgi:signal transduction histidine kinase